MTLFHITTRSAWQSALAAGSYRAASLATEGFIHLSDARQWLVVANRFYRGQADLVLLALHEAQLSAPVRMEQADGDAYPHLYGELNLDAVAKIFALPLAADGSICAPAGLAEEHDPSAQ